MPLIFDSGIRSGEDIVKALMLGADFVMLGRPVLYALGAEGAKGLNALIDCFVQDMDVTMAQLGVQSIGALGAGNIHKNHCNETTRQGASHKKGLRIVAGE